MEYSWNSDWIGFIGILDQLNHLLGFDVDWIGLVESYGIWNQKSHPILKKNMATC
jgi:hypothetical protein